MTETLETPTTEAKKYVGGGVLRKEDPELLTGQARFVDNITLPGMLWVTLVRSPYAHARIKSVDASRATEAEGVIAVLSGEELAGEWAAGLPCACPIADRTFPDPPTAEVRAPDHWPLTKDFARFAGDGVAVVVADSRAAAKDAAELVAVDYEPLEHVLEVEDALRDNAPLVHEQFGENRAYTWTLASGDVDRVFADAEVTVKGRYEHPRLIPNAIEPRAVVVDPVPAQGEFTMWSSTQIPHILKVTLALTCGIPETKLRVIAPDVGGGFGSKLQVYAEEALCLALARRLRRPVKWVEERSENYLATHHGRGMIQDVELAATAEGKLLGVRASVLLDMGAYYQLFTPTIPIFGAFLYMGVYEPEAYSFQASGVFTNKTPTDAYRGAGRPEATYAIERAMDALARRVGKDSVEIRRLNLIAPFAEPREVVSGLQFDSGDYEATLDMALERAGYDDLRREQAERRERGDMKQLGIGVSSYIEMCGIAPSQILAALGAGARSRW